MDYRAEPCPPAPSIEKSDSSRAFGSGGLSGKRRVLPLARSAGCCARPASPLMSKRVVVDRSRARDHRVRVEELGDASSRQPAEGGELALVVDEPAKSRTESLVVAAGDDDARVANCLDVLGQVCHHRRKPVRHGLEQRKGESLAARGEDEEVCGPEKSRNVPTLTEDAYRPPRGFARPVTGAARHRRRAERPRLVRQHERPREGPCARRATRPRSPQAPHRARPSSLRASARSASLGAGRRTPLWITTARFCATDPTAAVR